MISLPRAIIMLMPETAAVADAMIAKEDMAPHLLWIGAQSVMCCANRSAELLGTIYISIGRIDLESAPTTNAGWWA